MVNGLDACDTLLWACLPSIRFATEKLLVTRLEPADLSVNNRAVFYVLCPFTLTLVAAVADVS